MDAIVATLLFVSLVLAALPFLASRHGRARHVAIAGVLALAAAAASAVHVLQAHPIGEKQVEGRPIRDPTEGYAGSESCRPCHPHEHETWRASYHRRMTEVVAPGTVLGDFANVELELRGQHYRLRHDADGYWVETEDARHPIVMSTGSHHMQVYWYPIGQSRALAQLPFLWLVEAGRWVPRYAAFLRPEPESLSEEKRWNITCNKCHATGSRPGVSEIDDIDTRVAEFGISCEACHGEAKAHVRANAFPLRRYRQRLGALPDATITDPGDLAHDRASQVCGQCHGLTSFRDDATFETWKSEGYTYRPGDDLNDTRILVHQGQTHPLFLAHLREDPTYMERKFWPDGALRMAGREYIGLVGTPCFQRGTMSCLSCHAMHAPADDDRARAEWANDQLKPGMDGNAACLQCHDSFATPPSLTAHTRHEAGSSGSSCYNCHLPYTVYGLLKAIRSHQMDSPSVKTSIDTGRPNGCNQCHLDQTLQWTAAHLESWYGQPAPPLDDDQRSIAASVLWAVRGDASQRALMAWSFGWQPAREVSGSSWMTPFLVQLLPDPYDAVRYMAHRSLRTMPGYREVGYDFVGPAQERVDAGWRILADWQQHVARLPASERPPGGAVLVEPNGEVQAEILQRLLSERDNRIIELDE